MQVASEQIRKSSCKRHFSCKLHPQIKALLIVLQGLQLQASWNNRILCFGYVVRYSMEHAALRGIALGWGCWGLLRSSDTLGF